jgi:hypothetical protein
MVVLIRLIERRSAARVFYQLWRSLSAKISEEIYCRRYIPRANAREKLRVGFGREGNVSNLAVGSEEGIIISPQNVADAGRC